MHVLLAVGSSDTEDTVMLHMLPALTSSSNMFLWGWSDEIYANSIFGESPFQSAAQLVASAPEATQTAAADLCHVVFGLSKDWYNRKL